MKVSWWDIALFVAIFILAFGLRLSAVWKFPLEGDFAIHWQESLPLAQGTNLVFAGPTASMNTSFRQGPFYYYFLALLQIISNYRDRVVAILFAFINSLTMVPLYALARKFLSKKVSYFITFIFATGSYWVWVGGSPWNPNLIPFLTTSAVHLAWLIRYEHKTCWLPTLFILIAWITQSHITTLPVGFFLLWFCFDSKTWFQSWRQYVLGVSWFLLAWSPYLVYLLQENWQPLVSLLSIPARDDGGCTFAWWLQNHGHGETCFHWLRNPLLVFRTLAVAIFGANKILYGIAAGLITLLFTYWHWGQKQWRLVLVVPLTIVFYLFYKSYVYLHYFTFLLPFGLLFLGGLIEKVKNNLWLVSREFYLSLNAK